jgi:GMP synthase-like glutamine amidotransferase
MVSLTKFQASENFKKMIARANVSASVIDEKFRYIGTALVDNVLERRAMIEEEIREFKPQIVIIDGSADLVNDPNNGEECIKLKTYIRHLTE